LSLIGDLLLLSDLTSVEKQVLCSLDDFPCYTHGFCVFLVANRWRDTGVSHENRESREPFCLFDGVWDLLTSLFQDCQQCSDIVHIREPRVALNQQRLMAFSAAC
jgi:hypothetical protein